MKRVKWLVEREGERERERKCGFDLLMAWVNFLFNFKCQVSIYLLTINLLVWMQTEILAYLFTSVVPIKTEGIIYILALQKLNSFAT